MSSCLPDMEARLRAEEAMSTMLHARLHELAREVAGNTDAVTLKSLKTEVATLRKEMTEGFGEHRQALMSLEQRIDTRLNALQAETQTFQQSVDTRLNTMQAEAQAFQQSVIAHFTSIDERFAPSDERFASVDKQFTSIDKRFDHVYGELADMKANMMDMRNMLATLVAREK